MYPEGRQDDTHLSVAGATAVARLAARSLKTAAPTIGGFLIGIE
jgi:hypothetical protein